MTPAVKNQTAWELYIGWLHYFEMWKPKAIKQLFKRVAFVCRYGHTGYFEAMRIPIKDLTPFAEALGELIKEEAKALSMTSD